MALGLRGLDRDRNSAAWGPSLGVLGVRVAFNVMAL